MREIVKSFLDIYDKSKVFVITPVPLMLRKNADIKDYPPAFDYEREAKATTNDVAHVLNELMPATLKKVASELDLPKNNFIDAVAIIGGEKIGSTARKYYCRKWEGDDIDPEKIDRANTYTKDGIMCDHHHLNADGHKALAKEVYNRLKPLVEKAKVEKLPK